MTSTAILTLAQLIRHTAQLRRDLLALTKKFPEGDLELGDRIFVRLLNPVWRNPSGKSYDPKQQKQIAAIEWIEGYQNYLRDVEALIRGVMLKPELFHALPLHGLPSVPRFQYSAEECIRRLDLQEAALRGIQNGERLPNSGDKEAALDDLRARSRAAIDRSSNKDCEFKTGLHADTINDFLNGRTRPHKKTLEKLEQYLKMISPPRGEKRRP
jgi:hypothetical protein